jgi:hypothetical protein
MPWAPARDSIHIILRLIKWEFAGHRGFAA